MKTSSAADADVLSIMYLAADDFANGKRNEDYFLCVDAEKGTVPFTLSMLPLHSGYFLADAAYQACLLGEPLKRKSNRLRGRTPEEALWEYIGASSSLTEEHAIGYTLLSSAQAAEGSIDEAQLTLAGARNALTASGAVPKYSQLRVEECEAYLQLADWKLGGAPVSLARYASQLERAAAFAEKIDLPLRAVELRAQLKSNLGYAM